jgi:hypothetical protein
MGLKIGNTHLHTFVAKSIDINEDGVVVRDLTWRGAWRILSTVLGLRSAKRWPPCSPE